MKCAKGAILGAFLCAVLAGCGSETPTEVTSPQNAAPLPAKLKLDAAPADAKDVAQARGSMKDGDRVVVQGIVGGRVDPIAANRAILTLLDTNIKTCEQSPMDGCKTPWDACCEPADVIAKNSITVQVVNPQGQPLAASLGTLEGIKPKAKLIVAGIAKVTPDGALLVNADGIYVAK